MIIALITCAICALAAIATTAAIIAVIKPESRRDWALTAMFVGGTWAYYVLICVVLA